MYRKAVKETNGNPYTFKIPDYSAKSLRKIFEKHIGKQAKVTTDKWKGYNPIAKDYDLTQILSDKGANFKASHVMTHQVKSWIRTIHNFVLLYPEYSNQILDR